MKTSFKIKSLLMSMAIAGSSLATIAPATVQAGASANFGGVTTYVYRGLHQAGAAGQGGLDYETDSGLYAGVWASQVGAGTQEQNGLEYDVYGGWGGSFGGVDLGIGYIGYFYTNAFDDMYNELNLSVGVGGVTLAFNPGIHDAENADGDDSTNYYNVNLSGDIGPVSAELGYNDWDMDDSETKDGAVNTYLNLTYSMEISKGWEGSVGYVGNYQEDAAGDSFVENYLIVGVSTSFDL